ncbi:Translocation protein sec66 [Erysiphe neolycopersici]|uniref:Translocation protein sec66 n=1 Tax=Erysiphe neolycopersici TaxID=212602 RepID=A0A420HLX6_9PEZI|nr:Translocation protein sec66 [Erysiphe neolycopersici]
MFSLDWIGLSVPVAYIAVLVGSLTTFSSLYRKRKAAAAASLTPWFPTHIQRDIYLSLLHQELEGDKNYVPVPDSLKCAALLRRAVEDIFRIIQIRNTKQPCMTLLHSGSIGDDLWQIFLRAEKEMEKELEDVVAEANALQPNWGQTIFQSANEIAANTIVRGSLEEIQSHVDSEKKWWENRRKQIQSEFMKELDATSSSQSRIPNSANE